MYDFIFRMSRPTKGPTPPTTAGAAVPGPVAQQAQQYLEQNIMAWMQPKPQGQVNINRYLYPLFKIETIINR